MPQLNMAPTPGAALAVVSAKAPPANAPADAATEGQPVQPFAAVLKQQQVNQQQAGQQPSAPASETGQTPPPGGKLLPLTPAADLVAALQQSAGAAVSEPGAALGAVVSESAPVVSEPSAVVSEPGTAVSEPGDGTELPADAIAAIAPMLPGIIPAQPAVPAVPALKGGQTAQADDAENGIVPSLGATPAIPAQPAIPAIAPKASAETGQPAVQSAQGFAADPRTVSENFHPAFAQAGLGREEAGTGDFASLLASSTAAAGAAPGQRESNTARVDSAPLPVSTPVGAHGWDDEIGAKLTWMAGRQEGRAELVLNPPQLGRIEVSLSVHGDQASAMFVSPNSAVREALENAMPRLREILSDAGIALGQAQVGAESFRQPAGGAENSDNQRPRHEPGHVADSGMDGTAGTGQAPGLVRRMNGLVDTFA